MVRPLIIILSFKKPFAALGKNLLAQRLENEMTQERLAEKIGISLKYYQALEGGFKAPAFTTLSRIRGALGTSWDDLLREC
jgi:transcriptional regulator with XRE-family HTH domain